MRAPAIKEPPPPWVMGVAVGIGLVVYRVYTNDLGLSVMLGIGAVGGYVAWRMGLKDYPKWTLFAGAAAVYAAVVQVYFPDRFVDFMTTVKAWDGLSSMGGVLGALLGIFIFFRKEKIALTPYLDALALGNRARLVARARRLLPGARSPGLAHDVSAGRSTTRCTTRSRAWRTAGRGSISGCSTSSCWRPSQRSYGGCGRSCTGAAC